MTEAQIQKIVMALRNLAETARDIDTSFGDPERFAEDIDIAWQVLHDPNVKHIWYVEG